ncbi:MULTISPECIES: hypothetical protein [Methylicorpusculum]|uniref:hypothetical protein n=1 Tax=Methylicorpusculum TaxID=2713642 RepID=UPI00135A4FCA|nr:MULTISPECIES: hypothetical protein [Methylicorpusculum]MCD2450472.1 hypothetical protein [Methylicorpusculum oleiharenae]MDP3528575.1 hypothetical protein [Methylicorpusculum sp.]MDZ4153411.1 hypothetical protein [Methylicorpusculum sp.]
MQKLIINFGIILALTSPVVFAEAEFDFEELMESIDDNTHELQANIVNQEVDAGIALAGELKQSLSMVQGYFENRGDAQDAVDDAKQYQDMANNIANYLQARDFESASNEAIKFSQECDKACHDTYKPL